MPRPVVSSSTAILSGYRARSSAAAFALCDTAAVECPAMLASFRKQGSNPLGRCRLKHLFTSAVLIGRPGAALQ